MNKILKTALSVIDKNWQQPKYPSTIQWTNHGIFIKWKLEILYRNKSEYAATCNNMQECGKRIMEPGNPDTK